MKPVRLMKGGVLAMAALVSLGGCLGGGGGGGGGQGPGTPAPAMDFEARYDAARDLGLTDTSKPLTGTANYTGESRLTFSDPSNTGEPTGVVTGDLDLTVKFGAARPFTGTATGFEGELDGKDVAFDGKLSTDKRNAAGALPVNQLIDYRGENTIALFGMSGELTRNGRPAQIGQVDLTFRGEFRGEDGAALADYGSALVELKDGRSTTAEHRFYLDRD